MTKLKSINPSNYQVLGEVAVSTAKEIAGKVKLAHKAKLAWKDIGVSGRVEIMRQVFAEFARRQDEFTALEACEMGMPIAEARLDYTGTLDFAHWYMDQAAEYLDPETTFENDKEIHQVFHEPRGVAAIILPWNFPFANFVWGTVQSLLAGNTVVLKHSEECPLSGRLIEEVLAKHLPAGVFNEVYGGGEVGKLLVAQDINMIAFTGSSAVGKFLYETAGQKFIKAVMELGGSSPGVVFADADLNLLAPHVCDQRLYNAGQCCDGLKRLIVDERIFDQVIEKLVQIFAGKQIGPADLETTQIGPLVAKRQLDLLVSQVGDAQVHGAQIMVGGNSLEGKLGGAYFQPTIITNVTPQMRVWTEEVFGPVLPVIKFKTIKEAVKFANQTSYGLGSFVYTRDLTLADQITKQLEAGMVSVNGVSYIQPYNPFGGWKNSGHGREHGKYGFHEVTQIKLVAKHK